MTDLSDISVSGLWRVLAQDLDPIETKEWLDAFDAIVENEGAERATFVLRKLLDHARMMRASISGLPGNCGWSASETVFA